MPAMKKKNKQKYLTAVVVALIVLSLAAIIYMILAPEEESPVVKTRPAQKKQAAQPKTAAKEKPEVKSPAGTQAKDEKGERKAVVLPPKAKAKLPAKEKIVIAKVIPPRLPLKQVAIIIDDIGYDLKPVVDLLAIDADITFAILPLVAHSREAAEMLHKANRETLLHLPMEPLAYPKEKPGNGALFSDMNHDEIVFQLEKNMASVPHISGVNNHMGSKFMADEERLTLVFKQLKKNNLFFIDSRTTSNSKSTAASEKVHLKVASRKIFLDNERNYSKIYQILMDVAEAPAGNGQLIIIGHPYPETIRAIRDASKVFREKGVSIVPVSKLMQKTTS